LWQMLPEILKIKWHKCEIKVYVRKITEPYISTGNILLLLGTQSNVYCSTYHMFFFLPEQS